MTSELIQLRAVSEDGKVQRDVVVSAAMPLYHLHRVLQFCIKPRQTDDTIAAQSFKFVHKRSKMELKGTKSKLIRQAGPPSEDCLVIGTCWVYEAGKVKLELTLTKKGTGDGSHCVPRCIHGSGGNLDLDAVNKKLFERRFTKSGATRGRKKPPGMWATADTTNEEMWAAYMRMMRAPLMSSE